MSFDFDEIIDRVGTHSSKWDTMELKYGVSPKTGISMWVADMDFRAPPAVESALAAALDHGVHGYFGDDSEYRAALIGWMKRRNKRAKTANGTRLNSFDDCRLNLWR